MKFVKGQSGNPKGRKPGALNIATEIKVKIMAAFKAAKGPKLIREMLESNDLAKMKLALDFVAKIFPKDHQITGPEGGPALFKIVHDENPPGENE